MLKLEQLAELLEKNRAAAAAHVQEFSIGGRPFAFNSQPAIMGVINLSSDSWYRESVCLTADAAVQTGPGFDGARRGHCGRGRRIHAGPRRTAWTMRRKTAN